MCGLFGYAGSGADAATVRAAATEAARRGPHACGWSVSDGSRMTTVRYPAPLSACLPRLNETAGARIVIGQARMATSGDWRDPENNQPLCGGDLHVAHNGNVYNVRDLSASFDLQLTTGNDSEAILRLILAFRGRKSLPDAVTEAVALIDPESPMALLVAVSDALVAVRRGQPLYALPQPDGVYLSSRPFATAVPLNDRALYLFRAVAPETYQERPLCHPS